MAKVFRQGTFQDSGRIFEVMARAFKIEKDSPKYAARKKEAEESPGTFRLLELDGQVVCIVRILRQPMAVGRTAIIKGDVGEVSTDPDFQGRGLMTECMNDCVRWMGENGYDVSRLGGLVHFYSRFGYVPFPRNYVEFPLTSMSAAGRVQSARETMAPLDAGPGLVRHYRPQTDGPWRRWLSWRFNKDRTGAHVSESDSEPSAPAAIAPSPPESPQQLMSNPIELVYERDGRIFGFVSVVERPQEHSDFEAKVEIGSAAFDFTEPKVAGILVNHVLHIALERGAGRVTSRLPFDPKLYDSLAAGNVRFHTMSLHGAFASNMIRIINLYSLFQRIQPELDNRLSAAGVTGWRGALDLSVGDQTVGIEIGAGVKVVEAPRGAAASIALGQADLMRLVLGLCSAREMIRGTADARLLAILDILFPHQPTASGLWG